jgi:hypothetical protein
MLYKNETWLPYRARGGLLGRVGLPVGIVVVLLLVVVVDLLLGLLVLLAPELQVALVVVHDAHDRLLVHHLGLDHLGVRGLSQHVLVAEAELRRREPRGAPLYIFLCCCEFLEVRTGDPEDRQVDPVAVRKGLLYDRHNVLSSDRVLGGVLTYQIRICNHTQN